MPIVLRYDDFGPSTVSEYYLIEQALFQLFFELEIPMLVGAVPMMPDDAFDPHNDRFYPLAEDKERVNLMKYAVSKGFRLALHGYNHQVADRAVLSEFSGQTPQMQQQKIGDGIRLLESLFPRVNVETFIPPWNSHDNLTVDIVAEHGLSHLSAGDNVTIRERNGVIISPSYPIDSFLNYLCYFSLEDLIERTGDGYLVITFHAYQFLDAHPQFATSVEEFGQLLRKIQAAGLPIGSLRPEMDVNELRPTSERRLAARLTLFTKAQTSYGRKILGFSRSICRMFGPSSGRLLIDFTALGLYVMLRLYRRAV